jgi:peptide/nickel transport system permease protein
MLLVPAWLIMGAAAFTLIRLIPGDPAAVLLGMEATPQAVAELRARLGLDRPLPVQFVLWLSRVAEGELGRSFFLGQPVLDAILGRLPVTLSLTAAALGCAVLVGVPTGVRAATRPNSPTDLGAMAAAVVGLSIPDFALGLGLIVLFGVALQWLPVSGYVPLAESPAGFVQHLLLPALALGIPQGALIARITRSSMLEALGADYVRTARAKGLGEPAVVGSHAFRNTLVHVLTIVGSVAVVLLGGAFVVETVFNLPGLGNLVVMAVKRRDYPLVQGCLLLISTVVILVNLVVDVLYAYLDPQIRYG